MGIVATAALIGLARLARRRAAPVAFPLVPEPVYELLAELRCTKRAEPNAIYANQSTFGGSRE